MGLLTSQLPSLLRLVRLLDSKSFPRLRSPAPPCTRSLSSTAAAEAAAACLPVGRPARLLSPPVSEGVAACLRAHVRDPAAVGSHPDDVDGDDHEIAL